MFRITQTLERRRKKHLRKIVPKNSILLFILILIFGPQFYTSY